MVSAFCLINDVNGNICPTIQDIMKGRGVHYELVFFFVVFFHAYVVLLFL